MNDFKQLCVLRRSVRGYKSEPVPEEKLNYIKECVRLAPSACNRQPWKFVVVTDSAALRQLQHCYSREWFATAPCCVVALRITDEAWVRPSDGKNHGDIDVAIAVEHLCLAAAEQGLGSCWICNFDVARLKSLFQLSENEEPLALIPLGFPAEVVTQEKTRKTIAEDFC